MWTTNSSSNTINEYNDELRYACLQNDVDAVRRLCKLSANVEVESDCTPLMLATFYGNTEVVRELIVNQNAKIDHGDMNDMKPIHIACEQQHIDIVQLLIEHHASLAYQTKNGWTALHYAVDAKNFDLIKLLLLNGADKHIKDRYDLTPVDMAQRSKIADIICLFQLESKDEIRNLISNNNHGNRSATSLHHTPGAQNTDNGRRTRYALELQKDRIRRGEISTLKEKINELRFEQTFNDNKLLHRINSLEQFMQSLSVSVNSVLTAHVPKIIVPTRSRTKSAATTGDTQHVTNRSGSRNTRQSRHSSGSPTTPIDKTPMTDLDGYSDAHRRDTADEFEFETDDEDDCKNSQLGMDHMPSLNPEANSLELGGADSEFGGMSVYMSKASSVSNPPLTTIHDQSSVGDDVMDEGDRMSPIDEEIGVVEGFCAAAPGTPKSMGTRSTSQNEHLVMLVDMETTETSLELENDSTPVGNTNTKSLTLNAAGNTQQSHPQASGPSPSTTTLDAETPLPAEISKLGHKPESMPSANASHDIANLSVFPEVGGSIKYDFNRGGGPGGGVATRTHASSISSARPSHSYDSHRRAQSHHQSSQSSNVNHLAASSSNHHHKQQQSYDVSRSFHQPSSHHGHGHMPAAAHGHGQQAHYYHYNYQYHAHAPHIVHQYMQMQSTTTEKRPHINDDDDDEHAISYPDFDLSDEKPAQQQQQKNLVVPRPKLDNKKSGASNHTEEGEVIISEEEYARLLGVTNLSSSNVSAATANAKDTTDKAALNIPVIGDYKTLSSSTIPSTVGMYGQMTPHTAAEFINHTALYEPMLMDEQPPTNYVNTRLFHDPPSTVEFDQMALKNRGKGQSVDAGGNRSVKFRNSPPQHTAVKTRKAAFSNPGHGMVVAAAVVPRKNKKNLKLFNTAANISGAFPSPPLKSNSKNAAASPYALSQSQSQLTPVMNHSAFAPRKSAHARKLYNDVGKNDNEAGPKTFANLRARRSAVSGNKPQNASDPKTVQRSKVVTKQHTKKRSYTHL